MLASILIIAFSLVLLVYWFRYTCLLLLNGVAEEIATPVSTGLAHLQLANPAPGALQIALDRDYALLCYVLRHGAASALNPVERHMLTADYRVMRSWYQLTRNLAPSYARQALAEMSSIVCLLDRRLGPQAAIQA